MRTAKVSISESIVEQLGLGEMRMLALVVALRKTLGTSAYLKGDLSAVVVVALRKLIASQVVRDNGGTYSLVRPKPLKSPTLSPQVAKKHVG